MGHRLDITYMDQLREDHKLTLQEISDLSGVPVGSVKRIFSGNTENPLANTVADIIDSLGGSMDDAYGIKVTGMPHKSSEEISINVNNQPYEKALESSRSSYQNAFESAKTAYAEEINFLKTTVRDKNHWIKLMFIYSVALTGVVAAVLIFKV